MSDAGTAAKYGAVAGIYSQTTGEAQLELREQGIEAPATALAVGGLNAAVEFKALQFAFAPVFKKLAKQGATDRVTIASALKAAGKHAGVSMPAEALTEMTQTFTSKMAAQLHGGEYAFTDEAIKEYIDAGLKGGIVGGTMGGGAALMGQSRRAMGDAYLDRIIEANRELDGGTEDVGQTGSQTETTPETEESSGDTQSEQSPVQDAGGSDIQSTETSAPVNQQEPVDQTQFSAESEASLDAQTERLNDPERTDDNIVFISKANDQSWGRRLDEHKAAGLPYVVTDNDIILFDTEKNKAHYEKLVEQKGEDEARRRLKNYVQRKGEITDPENAQVVQTRDDQNNVVKEEVVESGRVKGAVDSQQATAKPTDEVVVTDPESAQQDRVDTIATEQYTPPAQGFGQETSDVQQEQAPTEKTRDEWLSELPEGWVIPKKSPNPWYKTKASATAAKNILKKKGGIYTVQPFGDGFALVPVENNLSPAPAPKTNPLPENITPEQVEDTPAQAEAALFDGQESDWQGNVESPNNNNEGSGNAQRMERTDLRTDPVLRGREGQPRRTKKNARKKCGRNWEQEGKHRWNRRIYWRKRKNSITRTLRLAGQSTRR